MSGISLAGDGGEAEFERELAWLEERLGELNLSPKSEGPSDDMYSQGKCRKGGS